MSFFIDGTVTESWGVSVGDGANEALLAPPTFKERYSYDWADGNGLEYDPDEVLYKKEQAYTLQFLVQGDSKQDVVSRYKAFLSVVSASAGFDLNSDVVIDPVHLYYTGGSIQKLSTKYMTLSLSFTTNFETAIKYGYLTTNNGAFITVDDKKIIVKTK